MSYELKLQRLEEILREFRYLKSMESLFELDQWGLLPEQGAAYRQWWKELPRGTTPRQRIRTILPGCCSGASGARISNGASRPRGLI